MTYTYLIKLFGPAVVGLILGFVIQGWRMDTTISDLNAKHQAVVSASIVKANEETLRLQRIKDEAIERANQIAQANARAADNARTEFDSLRLRLTTDASNVPTATHESLSHYTLTLQTVFGECSGQLERLAKKADGHALDARTLKESWGRKEK
jgi:hypothetical protein